MTGTYDWNPMPHRVDVTCPICRGRAEFEFAEVVRIKSKADLEYFQTSDTFRYQLFQDSCGHFWHGAIFFEGLHGSPGKALSELPAGYEAHDWEHSKYLRTHRGAEVGSVRCGHCGARRIHQLHWPDDAYFSIAYRGQVLWAYHRECAFELQHYLFSKRREVAQYHWSGFLLHVPTLFKTHKARASVVKQLQRLLSPAATGKRTSDFSNIS